MKIKPLNDYVLLRFAGELEQKTDSGIIVSTVATNKDIVRAKVIELPDTEDDLKIKIGDIVLVDKMQTVKLDTKDSLFLTDYRDLKGIVL